MSLRRGLIVRGLPATGLGYPVSGREPARRVETLAERFGDQIWQGGDGAPELNRAGADRRRPWM